jgi:phage shock protein B
MALTMLILGIIFLLIIAPIWIGAHYFTRFRAARGLTREDARTLGEIWESARRMEGRIDTLERLLDSELPGWRGGVAR